MIAVLGRECVGEEGRGKRGLCYDEAESVQQLLVYVGNTHKKLYTFYCIK